MTLDPVDSEDLLKLRHEILRLHDQALGAEARNEFLKDRITNLEERIVDLEDPRRRAEYQHRRAEGPCRGTGYPGSRAGRSHRRTGHPRRRTGRPHRRTGRPRRRTGHPHRRTRSAESLTWTTALDISRPKIAICMRSLGARPSAELSDESLRGHTKNEGTGKRLHRPDWSRSRSEGRRVAVPRPGDRPTRA